MPCFGHLCHARCLPNYEELSPQALNRGACRLAHEPKQFHDLLESPRNLLYRRRMPKDWKDCPDRPKKIFLEDVVRIEATDDCECPSLLGAIGSRNYTGNVVDDSEMFQ